MRFNEIDARGSGVGSLFFYRATRLSKLRGDCVDRKKDFRPLGAGIQWMQIESLLCITGGEV